MKNVVKPKGLSTSIFFDLAFVLLCSAFFSLLWIDYWVRTGHSIATIWPTVITATVTASLSLIWYIGKLDLGISIIAFVTLLYILIVPENPFNFLWVPVLALAFMSMTTGIYEVNYLFNKSMRWSRSRKRAILIVKRMTLLILIISIIWTATFKLGKQFMLSVQEDDKTPKIADINVRNQIKSFKELDIPEQKILYGAFSEIHLRDLYTRYYIDTRRKDFADQEYLERKQVSKSKSQEDDINQQNSPPPFSVPSTPSPSRETIPEPRYDTAPPVNIYPSFVLPSPSSPPTSSPKSSKNQDPKSSPPPELEQTPPPSSPDESEPIQKAPPSFPPPELEQTPSPSPLDESEPRQRESETLLESKRNNSKTKAILVQYNSDLWEPEYLQDLEDIINNKQTIKLFRKEPLDFFESLDRKSQKEYLIDRIKWSHPVSIKGKDKSFIHLPGDTAERRYEDLANYRICNALSFQSLSTKTLLKTFRSEYDYEVIDAFIKKDPITKDYTEPRQFIQPKEAECEWKEAFPELKSRYLAKFLKEQLSLPKSREAYLALEEYRLLARDLSIARDSSKQSANFQEAEFIQAIFEDFIKLPLNSQDAFIYYFINYFNDSETGPRKGKDNYQVFSKYLSSVEFGEQVAPEGLDRIRDALLDTKRQSLVDKPELESLFAKLQDIKNIESKREDKDNEYRNKLYPLLTSNDYPVHFLLNKQVQNLVIRLENKQNYSSKKRQEIIREKIFDALGKPIKVVIKDAIENEPLLLFDNKKLNPLISEKISKIFNEFDSLSEEEREEYLQDIAISLYKPEGPYSHNIFSLLIVKAPFVNFPILKSNPSLTVASFLLLPFVLLTAGLAWYAAQKLDKRDKQRSVAFSDKYRQIEGSHILGATDILRGRDTTISDMKRLAGRGWSAIAIVGRRGIGKTKILYELMKVNHENSPTVTAWISAPTKFEDAEFIESVLEGLTTNIESAVSSRCGAKPLAIRRLETNETIAGIIFYVILFLIFLVTFASIYTRAGGSEFLLSSLFIIVLLIISIGCLFIHWRSLQPIDLSSWLELDQTNNLDTVLLYREMSRIRTFLNSRKAYSGLNQGRDGFSYSRLVIFVTGINIVAYVLFALLILFVIFFITILNDNPQYSAYAWAVFIVIFFLVVVLALLLRREAQKVRGYTLMTLISEYREFLEKVVYRIRREALGPRPDFEVIVCIDELDKIIDQSELRNFIRRIKAIFEIPGVYYYISLSEDALKAFYLGTAEGKNEIDSAFDHIIYVPPVNCEMGQHIAAAYLDQHSEEKRHPRLERAIAATSYGVPRDILRRCDEILAQGNIANIEPSYVSDSLRIKLARLAYSEERLTKEESLDLTKSANQAIEVISTYFYKDLRQLRAIKIMLSIWTLALLSLSAKLPEEDWEKYSEKLRDIGYRISEENAENLIDELNFIQEKVELL